VHLKHLGDDGWALAVLGNLSGEVPCGEIVLPALGGWIFLTITLDG